MALSSQLTEAIAILSRSMNAAGLRWLIGGSCGLTLQHVAIGANPRDLDVYLDTAEVEAAYWAMEPYATNRPHYSETSIYESTLTHFSVARIQVELVGGFRVFSQGCTYAVEASYLYERHGVRHELDSGVVVALMPLAHELLFNMLRNRPDRYEAIAEVMRAEPHLHVPALEDLILRNKWQGAVLQRIEELTGYRAAASFHFNEQGRSEV